MKPLPSPRKLCTSGAAITAGLPSSGLTCVSKFRPCLFSDLLELVLDLAAERELVGDRAERLPLDALQVRVDATTNGALFGR